MQNLDIDKAPGTLKPLENKSIEDLSKKIAIDKIKCNPYQPRKIFSENKISELSKSILENGIIQPLLVATIPGSDDFQLIAGERRLRAAKMAHLKEVPVVIKSSMLSDSEALKLAILENIQREDLNPIEEALAIQQLISEFNFSQEDCAQKLGKDRTSITNILRLLKLPDLIQLDVLEDRLSAGHAKVLLALATLDQIKKMRDLIIKNHLSVRQAERLVRTMLNKDKGKLESSEANHGNSKRTGSTDYLLETLRERLRTKVRLIGSTKRGKLEVSFFSQADLERILEILGVTEI